MTIDINVNVIGFLSLIIALVANRDKILPFLEGPFTTAMKKWANWMGQQQSMEVYSCTIRVTPIHIITQTHYFLMMAFITLMAVFFVMMIIESVLEGLSTEKMMLRQGLIAFCIFMAYKFRRLE